MDTSFLLEYSDSNTDAVNMVGIYLSPPTVTATATAHCHCPLPASRLAPDNSNCATAAVAAAAASVSVSVSLHTYIVHTRNHHQPSTSRTLPAMPFALPRAEHRLRSRHQYMCMKRAAGAICGRFCSASDWEPVRPNTFHWKLVSCPWQPDAWSRLHQSLPPPHSPRLHAVCT